MMQDPSCLLSKGACGLYINGTVPFVIETVRVPSAKDWLYAQAKRYGIDNIHGSQVIANNSDPEIHHLCHAWSAYVQSGFKEASILVIDGMNKIDGVCIGIFEAFGDTIKTIKTYPVAHSLGSLYFHGQTACGFGLGDCAGRVMGAAAWGDPVTDIAPFLMVDPETGDVLEAGASFELITKDDNRKLEFTPLSYLDRATNGMDIRYGEKFFDFRSVKMAATIQWLFEQAVFSLLEYMKQNLQSRNLIITGGCALNCVCNGKVIRSGDWDDLFIPNMCEDQGNIIGRMVMEYGQKVSAPYIYNKVTYRKPKEYSRVISKEELAEKIRVGQIVAWFEGGSEYGPRALCHRSILANPSLKWINYRINEIKHREYWRPLAPVVLDTHFPIIFDVPGHVWNPHRIMLATEYIREEWRQKIPAVCAPDFSSRPQVLFDVPANHTLYSMMSEYELPILLNTSMNDAGEPICETPEDAIRFASKNSDVLFVFIENGVIYGPET